MATHQSEAIAQAKVDSTEYFLFQDEKGGLTSRIREGKGASLSAPERVGSAKPGAPVTLTVNPFPAAAEDEDAAKVVALAIGADGTLQDFLYDEGEGEWKRGHLRGAGVAAREDAEFTAAFDKDGATWVFAVTKPNQIVVTSAAAGGGGGLFSPPETLSVARPAENASLFAVAVDGAVNAFYSHEDLSIHRLVKKDDGEWQDILVEQTNDGTKKFNVVATAATAGGFNLQWANAKQEVYSLLTDGKVIKYGEIDSEGGVKKTSEAQAWYYEEEIVIRRRWWWY